MSKIEVTEIIPSEGTNTDLSLDGKGSGKVAVQDAITVAGKAEFDSDVCVSGNSILVGNLTVGGTTTIGGAVSIAGAISVGGIANFGKTVLAKTDTDTSNTGSITLDFETNQNFVLTFTGNVTFANPSTEQVGQSGVIVCIQDGTGSRTLSLGTDYETAGGSGITLSTGCNAVDVIPYFIKAANSIQLGAVQLAFS